MSSSNLSPQESRSLSIRLRQYRAHFAAGNCLLELLEITFGLVRVSLGKFCDGRVEPALVSAVAFDHTAFASRVTLGQELSSYHCIFEQCLPPEISEIDLGYVIGKLAHQKISTLNCGVA